MTSTSFNVGLNSATRNSSKVLKPPGGGSSDIFGTSGPEPEQQQRKIRNQHLSSSIFSGEESQTPSRNKAGNDSFYNLFGAEPQSRPVSAVKDKIKSNIVLEDSAMGAKKSLAFSEEDCKTEIADARVPEESKNIIVSDTNGVHKTDGCEGDGQHDEACTTSKSGSGADSLSGSSESNHVTTNGEKVEVAVNGASSVSNSSASTPAPVAAPAAPSAQTGPARQRVPPGGFSSGLW